MRVLVVKLSSMGDVVHAFTAVADAKAARPDVTFDWCVDGALADLVRLNPAISTVHRNDVIGVRRAPGGPLGWGAFWRLRRALRRERYDLVIDAQGLIKSAAVSRLAGAPVAGYDRRSVREPMASLAYQRRFAIPWPMHAVTRMRTLFGMALDYEPDLTTRPDALKRLAPAGAPGRVFLVHGTAAESKRWPTGHWIGLARHLVEQGLTPVVTWSNDAEHRVAETIRLAVPAVQAIPRRPLGEIAAEICGASLVVGVDTGLAHLADAAGVPTIMLFQASSPALTGPMGVRSEALVVGTNAPSRPLRRLAHLPADAKRIVPVDRVVAAVTHVVGQFG